MGEYKRRGHLNSKPLKHESCGGAEEVEVEERDELGGEEGIIHNQSFDKHCASAI